VFINDTRGFAGLIEPIAAGLKDIRFHTIVSEVDYSGKNGITVHTSAGVLDADYVVMTASLGVLKTDLISFTPALPSKTQKAIKHLGCDVADFVVLEFPEGSAEHWGGAEKDVFYIMGKETAHHGEFVEIWNAKHYRDVDALISVSVGPRDWALVEDVLNNDQLGQSALAQLRLAFPSLPEPTKVHVYRWGRDFYARCAWSSWFLGSSKKERDAFLSGVGSGRLLFAGEHTDSSHPGTTHGAWNTGVSAAAAITTAETSAGLGAEGAVPLRAGMHQPRPQDVFKGRPMRSPRKEWSRMQKSEVSIV
jgi:polyamine oxidase